MLKKTINKLLHDDKGATLIIVAVCLLIVFGFAAISADAGLLYKTRRDMVAAADACALAVAQEMADTANALTLEDAQTLAESYKGKADSVSVEFVTLDNGDKAVKADVVRNEDYFFGKLISNKDNSNVVATATATWGYPTNIAGGNVLPLFVQESDYNDHLADPDLNIYLHDNEGLPGGHWGYLDIYGNSSDIRKGIQGGFDLTLTKPLVVDQEVPKGTGMGNKLSFTRDGVGQSDKDINKDGRIVRTEAGLTEMTGLVPIVKNITDAGKTTVTIVGFAYYQITDCVQKNGYGLKGGPYYQTDADGNLILDHKGDPIPYPDGTVIGGFTTGITDIKVIAGDQKAAHNYGSYYVDLIE